MKCGIVFADYTDRVDLRACKSVLLFGGSFDPPHVAHLALPLEAMKKIGADAVAYIPAALSPFKQDQPPTEPTHRLAMLRLMLAHEDRAVILTDELDRASAEDAKPSYTIDTIAALHQRLGEGIKLRLLIGADQLASFDRWRQWERVIELAEPVVMVRPPATRESMLANLPEGFDVDVWRTRMVDLPVMDVSATAIRQRIAAGQSIRGMVVPAVETYIHKHGLYRA